jgi:uroporphyrinogen-III synthase
VIEYGRPDHRLLDGLEAQGREVIAVSAYGYALPEDTGPALEAIARMRRGEVDAIVFTASAQFTLLEELAGGSVAGLLDKVLVASIGPTTTETLEAAGVRVDLEANPPKMGMLVHQLGEWCGKNPKKA